MGREYTNRVRLGGGSQGETFLATDSATGKKVVLKVVRLSGGGNGVKDIELWERECDILATLDHPAIPKYLDHYTHDLLTEIVNSFWCSPSRKGRPIQSN